MNRKDPVAAAEASDSLRMTPADEIRRNPDAPKGTTSRSPRGEGTSLTIDFKDNLTFLAEIRAAAKEDDREPARWLRKQLIALKGHLFPAK